MSKIEVSVDGSPGITFEPIVSEWLVLFCGKDNKQLVGVRPDATVVIFEHGAEKEAADIFWDWIQVRGKTLIAELAEAKAHIAKLEERLDESPNAWD